MAGWGGLEPTGAWLQDKQTGVSAGAQSCPQSAIAILVEVLPPWLPLDSICFTTSIPSITLPNTTCFPSSLQTERLLRDNKWHLAYVHASFQCLDPSYGVQLVIKAYHGVLAVQMKNWDPLVFGPALAMDRMPSSVCFRVKFSSANLLP